MAAILGGVVLPPQAGYRGWQAALPTWVPVALFLVLLVRVWIPPYDRNDSVLPRQTPNEASQQPPWLLAAVDALVGVVFSCCVLWLGMYAHLLAMPANGITALMVSLGGAGLVALGLAAGLEGRVERPAWLPGALLLGAATALLLLPMASQEQRWPLWLAAAGIGFTLFACHELLVARLLAPEAPMTSDLLVGIGEAVMASAHPASAFSATQASPLTGGQPDAPSTQTGAFSPSEDPGPFPSTLGGPVPNDTATVTAETSPFPSTATFAATSAFPTSTMQLSPETQPEAPAAQPSGPDSRFFSPTTGGTRVKHNPPEYARAPSPAPDALQDRPETATPASVPPSGPTISAAPAPSDDPEDGIEEPRFEAEDGEIPLPEGTIPPALLAENTNRLTTVTPNPAITQLITAHFLGGAAGPLVLGFMTGSLSGFGFLWYVLAVLLVLAGALYLMPKHHRGV
jgi:putative ABC transporter